jgi:hypothetical protein
MVRPMIIDGRHFELTLCEQPGGDWHWLITAPGKLVLSGDAASETQALEVAWSAGETLARLAAA